MAFPPYPSTVKGYCDKKDNPDSPVVVGMADLWPWSRNDHYDIPNHLWNGGGVARFR